jgi:hypothetical protein
VSNTHPFNPHAPTPERPGWSDVLSLGWVVLRQQAHEGSIQLRQWVWPDSAELARRQLRDTALSHLECNPGYAADLLAAVEATEPQRPVPAGQAPESPAMQPGWQPSASGCGLRAPQ